MEHVLVSPTLPRRRVLAGRALSGLAAGFLLVDGAAKVFALTPAIEATQELGYSPGVVVPLGLLLVTCTVLYIVPRTRLLGALLLTAYLGGATATHVRIGDPFWFPVLVGAILWAGLWLRDPRLGALLGR